MEQFYTGEYPHLVEMASDYYRQPGYNFGDEFEWGRDLILDGLDRRAVPTPGLNFPSNQK